MSKTLVPVVLAIGIVVAAIYAFVGSRTPSPMPPSPTSLPEAFVQNPSEMEGLPPNHPAVSTDHAPTVAANEDPPAITWTMPADWTLSPTASSMRIATYHVPTAKGDSADTEVTVVRAGGSVDANIDRWVGQFEDAGKDVRTTKKVAGLRVTTATVSGTYLGGGMMGSSPQGPHVRWSLVGAIVETPDSAYFFKMTGPTATVNAARKHFDAMIDGITAE